MAINKKINELIIDIIKSKKYISIEFINGKYKVYPDNNSIYLAQELQESIDNLYNEFSK